MAVELNIGDVVEIRLNYRDANQSRAFNILHYRLANVSVSGGGEFTGVDFADVANELAEVTYDNLAPVWATGGSASVVFEGISVANVFPLPRSAQYHYVADPATPGEVVGDAMPLQDSPTIVKRTAFGARWGIGRLFYVGISESVQANGVLNTTGRQVVQDFANELAETISFVEAPNTYFFTPVLFGQRPLEPDNPRITQIVSIDLSDPIIKTQRRRRPGKGI